MDTFDRGPAFNSGKLETPTNLIRSMTSPFGKSTFVSVGNAMMQSKRAHRNQWSGLTCFAINTRTWRSPGCRHSMVHQLPVLEAGVGMSDHVLLSWPVSFVPPQLTYITTAHWNWIVFDVFLHQLD